MKFLTITSAVAMLVLSQVASAVAVLPYINGTIDIGGLSTVVDDGFGGFDGITFGDKNPTMTGDQGTVTAASGAFAALQTFPDSYATLTSFSLSGSGLPVTLWSADDGTTVFSFSLNSLVVDAYTGPSGYTHLLGTGVMSAAGFADTNGTWDYTSQSGVSFSSNTVPEPSIVALMAIGLLGFGYMGRRQKKSS